MPWKIRAGGEGCPFEVVNADTGKRVACHDTRKEATAHMRALYANVPDAKDFLMDVVEKTATATVEPVEHEKGDSGEFTVILSTEALDRDDENLWAEEWKQPLPDRIHIDGDHGRSLEKTVGSAIPRLDGNRLIGEGTYASTDYAQMVRQLVKEGHVRNLSVTYTERKNEKSGGVQRELLNAAFVAVPANPEAIVLSSKAKSDDGDKPYGDVRYADPGYQDDGKARYPIDSEAHCRAAWSYINQSSNASKYSAEQVSTIKGRIRSAGKKFGIEFSDEKQFGASGNNPDHAQKIHDAAVQLGAQCREMKEQKEHIDKTSPESTEDSTAPTADETVDAAEKSADNSVKQRALLIGRAAQLQFIPSDF